jgi:hypothetical protein
MKICNAPECPREAVHTVMGYCDKHYQQLKSGGIRESTRKPRPATILEDTALIPLGLNAKGGYATVDLADAWVADYLWTNHHNYAEGVVKTQRMGMQRLIMNPPKGMQVDHINLDTLDNRRANLRVCTQVNNSRNSGKHKNNTTGYKGVIKLYDGKYAAKLGYKGKKLHLGTFEDPIEAAKAYDRKALELHGEFALLNF